jgi:hypothetical protein
MAAPLDYLPREILSYLPTGWNLADEVKPGRWVAEDAVWNAVVLDGAEQSWELEVKAADAARLGRLEALREAFDQVYKSALGRRSILG